MIQLSKQRRGIRGTAVIAVVLATAAAALTQTMPRNQAEFEQQIGITAAQKTKIKNINDKYKPRLEAVKKKYQPQAEKLRKQMITLGQQMEALNQKMYAEAGPALKQQENEIKAVFTPEQQKKIAALQAQQQKMQQQMQQQQGGGGAPR